MFQFRYPHGLRGEGDFKIVQKIPYRPAVYMLVNCFHGAGPLYQSSHVSGRLTGSRSIRSVAFAIPYRRSRNISVRLSESVSKL